MGVNGDAVNELYWKQKIGVGESRPVKRQKLENNYVPKEFLAAGLGFVKDGDSQSYTPSRVGLVESVAEFPEYDSRIGTRIDNRPKCRVCLTWNHGLESVVVIERAVYRR